MLGLAAVLVLAGLGWVAYEFKLGPERIANNERSSVDYLKSLTLAQEQFKGQAMVDQDADGTGEYGYFQELAGTSACRSTGIMSDPSFMSPVFGATAREGGGIAEKNGYDFAICLPDSSGRAVRESAPLPHGDRAAANNQETNWVCYAWPTRRGVSGNRAFVVNQEGLVYQCSDEKSAWDGPVGPSGDAAFPLAGDITGPIDAGGPGQGRDVWTPAGG